MDMKAEVKLLVQQVVEAYVKDQLQKESKTQAAILLGYPSVNPTEVINTILPLLDSYDLTFLITKEWLTSFPELNEKHCLILEETSSQELKEIVECTSILVIPVASYQLLAKLALTMDDEVPVWLAIQFQLQGKPIVIASNHIEPNVYQQIKAPFTVQERIQDYIRQIRADQVKWEPLSKLPVVVDHQLIIFREKQPLILGKHIEIAHQEGLRKLDIPQKSRITPMAKDLAKELTVELINKDSLKGGEL